MKSAKIVIAGYFGSGNFGDDLILKSIVDYFHTLGECQIDIVEFGRSKLGKSLEASSVLYTDNERLIEVIAQSNLVMIGGGGIFQVEEHDPFEKMFTRYESGQEYYLKTISIAKLLGKRIVIFSNSFANSANSNYLKKMNYIISSSDRVSVRDFESYQFVKHNFGSDVAHIGDAIFALDASNIEGASKTTQVDEVAPKKVVGVNIRNILSNSEFTEFANFINTIHKDYTICFFSFQEHTSDDGNDFKVLTSLVNALDSNDCTVVQCDIENISRVVNQLACCSLMIGMRLHSVVLSYLLHVPFLALSYDSKVANFCAEVCRKNSVLSREDWCFENLYSKFDDIVNATHSSTSEIYENFEQTRTSVQKELEEIYLTSREIEESRSIDELLLKRLVKSAYESEFLSDEKKGLERQNLNLINRNEILELEVKKFRNTFGFVLKPYHLLKPFISYGVRLAREIRAILKIISNSPGKILTNPHKAITTALLRIKNTSCNSISKSKDVCPDFNMSSVGDAGSLISIIIPVYNHADYLEESVNSVLDQSYKNIEVVVVDDGSTDDIESVLNLFVNDPRVIIVRQENSGLPAALNTGFSFANGQFFTWTSADNVMHDRQIEILLNYLLENPNVGMCYANYYVIDENGSIVDFPNFRPHNRSSNDSNLICLPMTGSDLSKNQDNYIGACFLYRRDVARTVGEYCMVQGVEDYDYWLRISYFFGANRIDSNEPLYSYRVHSNTLSSNAMNHSILLKAQKLIKFNSVRNTKFSHKIVIGISARADCSVLGEQFCSHEIIELNEYSSESEIGLNCLIIDFSFLKRYYTSLINSEISIGVLWDQHLPWLLYYKDFFSKKNVAIFNLTKDNVQSNSNLNLCIQSSEVMFSQFNYFVHCRSNVFDYMPIEYKETSKDIYVNRKIRLLVQVENYNVGGLEQVVVDSISALKHVEDLDIAVLSISAVELGLFKKKLPDGIDMFVLEEFDEPKYESIINDYQPDVLHSHYSVKGLEIANKNGAEVVQTIHNCYVWFSEPQKAEFRRSLNFTSKCVCVSNAAAAYLYGRLGVPLNMISVIRNGLGIEKYKTMGSSILKRQAARDYLDRQFSTTGEYLIGMTGSITSQKNQLAAIKAFELFFESRPCKSRLLIFGKPLAEAYYQELVSYVTERNLPVDFVGYFDEVVNIVSGFDCILMPSLWEGWSIALAEALLLDIPIISSDAGSALEFSDCTNLEVIPNSTFDFLDLDIQSIQNCRFGQQHIEKYAESIERVYDHLSRERVPFRYETRLGSDSYLGYVAEYKKCISKRNSAELGK